MENYLNHLKEAGRLFYIYKAIAVIRTEGKDWEGADTKASKGFMPFGGLLRV